MNHVAPLMEAGAEIVAACATVRGAVECIRDKPVDVAVADYVLADGNSEPLQTAEAADGAVCRIAWRVDHPLHQPAGNRRGSAAANHDQMLEMVPL
jgi:hypothetical protein